MTSKKLFQSQSCRHCTQQYKKLSVINAENERLLSKATNATSFHKCKMTLVQSHKARRHATRGKNVKWVTAAKAVATNLTGPL